MSDTIHSTAIIDSTVELSADVSVGPYSIISGNVKIGRGTKVGPHVVIEGNTTIGEECEIFQFASIGAKPQDLKFQGEPSTLVIGSGNKIREYVTLQPGTKGGIMTTEIGDNNLFMANSHVGHDCRIGNRNIFANSVALAGHVTVFDGAIVGGLAGIHQFVRVGSYSFLSAGSKVGQDIPPYCFGQGDRCYLRGVNVVGLQRNGFSPEEVTAIKKSYRLLFGSVGGLEEKINGLPSELSDQKVIQDMIDFIKDSERGVAQPLRSVSSTD